MNLIEHVSELYHRIKSENHTQSYEGARSNRLLSKAEIPLNSVWSIAALYGGIGLIGAEVSEVMAGKEPDLGMLVIGMSAFQILGISVANVAQSVYRQKSRE